MISLAKYIDRHTAKLAPWERKVRAEMARARAARTLSVAMFHWDRAWEALNAPADENWATAPWTQIDRVGAELVALREELSCAFSASPANKNASART